MAVIDVSQSKPLLLATVAITAVPPSTRNSAQDPCAGTAVTTLNAVAVTALPDGSRTYVGAFYEDTASPANICPQVTVINTSSNTVKTTVAVTGFPNFDATCASTRFRFTMAAAGDSSRAYLAACDVVCLCSLTTEAPFSNRPPNPQPPPQNPVFLIAGP